MSGRTWRKYDFKVGNRIRHSGITSRGLEVRESEYKQRWPNGHIVHVGRATAEESAREREDTEHKTITPKMKMTRSRIKASHPS
jgi:hypothetical protein